MTDLADLLNSHEFDGIAIDKQPSGFTASILFGSPGDWSPREFAASASGALKKCLQLHGCPATLAPPPY